MQILFNQICEEKQILEQHSKHRILRKLIQTCQFFEKRISKLTRSLGKGVGREDD